MFPLARGATVPTSTRVIEYSTHSPHSPGARRRGDPITTPRLSFGTGTTVKDFAAYPEWLRTAEGAGFDLLTTGDSQSLWADPFIALTVAAGHTSRARLAVTVSNPMTRHPAVVASCATALQQLSGGRFAYGISSGDSALRNIGVRPGTLAELADFVAAVRNMCAGRPATFGGADVALHWDHRPTPIWMAAEGPRTLRLAGRIADGVILSNSLTAEAYRRNLGLITEGAAEVGRDVAELEIWCMANLVPAPTERAGIDRIRSVLAGTANHVYRFTMAGKGVPAEIAPRLAALQAAYDSRHHASPDTAHVNAELVDRYGLTDWLAARSTIAGPPEACVERLHEIAEAGITRLILSQFVPEPLAFMRLFADRIAPHFH
ncbi:LLM class flavin-dependent oxidoreductase [Embleya sp. NPDC050493]|uniref:LLM class flavin-dependent oxidoreductase n=1 Tax=Embleya sp. NPDC050493 TaxID=3363989 RepID=UPI0037983B7B